MRKLIACAVTLGAACLSGPRAALADGAILTDGADIAAGAGTPPGLTIVDQLAPPAPDAEFAPNLRPPALPNFTSDIPAMPAFVGSAPDVVAAAGTTTTFDAGTHDFASFTVEGGAAVECTGPVTIRVKGTAAIHGSVTSSADGASIAFQCGADFTMGSGSAGNSSPAVVTNGLASPISVDTAGRIACDAALGTHGAVRATHGDVVLRQRGESLLVRRVDVATDDGRVDVRSPDSIKLVQSEVRAAGDVELRAFGGGLDATDTSLDATGALRVHSKGQLTLYRVDASADGPIDVASMGDRLYLTDSTVETADGSVGDLTLRSQRHMYLLRSTVRHRGSGTLAVHSDVSVSLEYPGISRTSSLLHEGTGSVRVLTGGMFITYGDVVVSASHGDVVVHTDFVEVNGPARFSAVEGALELNSARSVRLRADPTGDPALLPTVEAGAVRITNAGDLSNQLSVERLDAGAGGLAVTTRDRTTLRGTFASAGPVIIRCFGDTIDLAGADIRTASTSGTASAPVIVENVLAYDASIDARGARIRSGDATGAGSGDVVLLLRRYAPSRWAVDDPNIEDGAMPSILDSVAVDAHRIRISWIPREPDATGLLVERAEAGGEFAAIATLPGDAFFLVDQGLAPDTEYVYRVSVLTSFLLSTPSDPVHVRTRSSIRVRVLRADVVEKDLRNDTVALSLKVRFDERPAGVPVDPTAETLRVAAGSAFSLVVPAQDPRWTKSGGSYEWRGPVGAGGTATLRFDPARGRLDVRARGYGVVQPDAERTPVSVRLGADGGSKAIRSRGR